MNKDLQINRVGLKNVQERIRLNYGPGYGLTVTGGPAAARWSPSACPAPDRERRSSMLHIMVVDDEAPIRDWLVYLHPEV